MESPQNKVLHKSRFSPSRNCPSLFFSLCLLIVLEQSGTGKIYHNVLLDLEHTEAAGHSSPHTRFSTGSRSELSTALVVTGKFQILSFLQL